MAGQVPTRHDGLQLIGSTPLPRAAPRKTVTRSKPAGHAGHGYRGSHGRFFRDVRL
ncbi:hypothetical protein [Streptomyces panaciradicis]|uniref:hypothetical protein n=1 Tax=Streptomyces panaciradicis TaxID=1470261 RepID=UPI00201CF17E|nr:hypothetical protein [Streptomyces panaciradicis]MCL6675169.1 hypothetical protein [Streptomyces panaciradicis]